MTLSIKWFPRSWFQMETERRIIYIDPAYFKAYQEQFNIPQEKGDLILVTHAHGDHCRPATIDKIRRPDTIIVGPKLCARKVRGGLKVVKAGEDLTFGHVAVRAVEAYNIPKPGSKKVWHRKGDGIGYVVTAGGKAIYHAGDTDLIPEMKELGHVDIAMLPIGGTYTMNLEEAVEAAIAIKPKIVIPMHNLEEDPRGYKKKVEARSKIKVFLAEIGRSITWDD